ncbi:MAG: hypothetical protein ACYCX3_13060 [Thermoleophilia bacterium]
MGRDDVGHFFLDSERPRLPLVEINESVPRISEWNQILVDLLLPLQSTPGSPVLLCCDDDTLRKAAGGLGVAPERATETFAGVLRVAYSIGEAGGLKRAAVEGAHFDRLPKPRPVPGFLSLLCLCVLAATHMEGDGTNTAAAYYPRLRELLSFSAEGGAPNLFECVPLLFRRLGEWLEEDLLGSRGTLASLDTSALPYVGPCVSQTVFRRADINVLASFFEQKLARTNLRDIDPLMMLRHWGERHRLTRHGLALAENPELAGLVRSTLETAYRNWDGTVPALGGRGTRGCRATLVIRPSPPFRLGLRLPVESVLAFQLGDHQIRAEPGATAWIPERALALALTTFANSASVRARTATGGELTVRISSNQPGAFFFAVTADGVWQVGTPSQARELFVLTGDGGLVGRLDKSNERYDCDLPEGWVLFHSVPAELVGGEGDAGHTQPFALVGGLAIDSASYLPGAGPNLAAGADKGLELEGSFVMVNGEFHHEARPGGTARLPCSEPGSYEVEAAGGLFRTMYHVVRNGPREGLGGLCYSVGPDVLRRGAAPRADDGVTICGPLIFPGHALEALPYLPRGKGRAITIRADGSSARFESRSDVPPWLQKVLGAGRAPRWEVPLDGAVWVLLPKSKKARLYQDTAVTLVDLDLADIIVCFGLDCRIEAARTIDPPVAEDRWLGLLIEAQALLEVEDPGA